MANGHPERDMCIEFVSLLTHYEALGLAPDLILWTHNDNGQVAGGSEKARKIAGGIAKRMGTKAGWPDYEFLFKSEQDLLLGFIEAKVEKRPLTKQQREFKDVCQEHGILWGLGRSVDEMLNILESWGVINSGWKQ